MRDFSNSISLSYNNQKTVDSSIRDIFEENHYIDFEIDDFHNV